ncbi:glycosyltransferase [Prosthecobacter sp.]|uniref:glycosyltransferase n=1 Tax=Prosthecobacter sp. TaxID=1965333 RepID=UPI001DE4E849|nr:glycosyltransferase [Prosthecobacter sp.]MCB1277639.1 glycosyltransferase family 1 protein [Prosthecobacter sp.]
MAKIVLLPHGTAGDVLPYIWLGRHLLKRGHRVSMIWIESFRNAAERAGLHYVTMQDDGFDELLANPVLWQRHKGMKLVFENAGSSMGGCLDAFESDAAHTGRPDLLIAPINNFSARLLREKTGIPLVTLVLYPLSLVSAYEVPGGLPCGWLLRMQPLWVRKLVLGMTALYDRHALPKVREYCIEHGVTPPRRLQKGWWYSPDGVLALFPEWYARPQPDWPDNHFQWAFPLEDLADTKPPAPELTAFLDAGERPVVFTFGTGNQHAKTFFKTAAALVQKAGCRAVFVTRDAGQVPASLPDSIHVTPYAPFSGLFARSRACVHHGGIGTMAQCFAAGLPQFITSITFDQPDNAERLRRMGAGVSLDIRRFNVRDAEPLLKACLEDPLIRTKAQEVQRLAQARPAAGPLIEWLEARLPPNARSTPNTGQS